MKSKTVKMISSVVMLAVLCGTYFGVKTYVAKQEEQENAEEEEQATNILSQSADDIKSLKFIIDKKEVTFTRDDDSWIKQDETDFPVNQDKLEEAASSMSSIDADRVLEGIDDLYEYGLDEPINTITVTTEDGEETSIRIGIENESTSQYYINKNEDRETVYVIGADIVEPFMDSLYDYAQMEDFPAIDSSNIYKVEIKEESSIYSLDEDEDTGMWYISDGDEREKADSASATTLTSSINGLEYASFADYNCANKEKYGLDQPYAEINVYYNDEKESLDDETEVPSDDETEVSSDNEAKEELEMEQKQLTIYIGNEAEDNTRYVSLDDSAQIYTISDEKLSAFLGKEKSDFLDLTVNYLSVNNLSRLNVDYNDESHVFDVSRETLENEDGEEEENITYYLDNQEMDSTQFTIFYNKLINMVAQRRIEEKYEGDNPAEMTVEFVDTDGNINTVEYYSYDTNYYAAVANEKTYLVNKMTIKEMISSYESIVVTNDSEDFDVENSNESNVSDMTEDVELDSETSDIHE